MRHSLCRLIRRHSVMMVEVTRGTILLLLFHISEPCVEGGKPLHDLLRVSVSPTGVKLVSTHLLSPLRRCARLERGKLSSLMTVVWSIHSRLSHRVLTPVNRSGACDVSLQSSHVLPSSCGYGGIG